MNELDRHTQAIAESLLASAREESGDDDLSYHLSKQLEYYMDDLADRLTTVAGVELE